MGTRPRRFLIWGAGGHGRMVADLVQAIGWEVIGFIDLAAAGSQRPIYLESDLLEHLRESREYPNGVDAVAVGIGDNRQRLAKMKSIDGLESPPLVHPSATVSATAELGRGTVVFPHAVVNAGTRIGEAVIINSGAIVEHDCTVESGAHISPGATVCGGVRIGECTWVGAGATVIHGLNLGNEAIVGAGSTVLEDVARGAKVVGSPAHPLNRQDQ